MQCTQSHITTFYRLNHRFGHGKAPKIINLFKNTGFDCTSFRIYNFRVFNERRSWYALPVIKLHKLRPLPPSKQAIKRTEAKALRPFARYNFPVAFIPYFATKKIKWLIFFVNVMKSTVWLLCLIQYFYLAPRKKSGKKI